MASGDVTITVAIAGGSVSKSVTITSDNRVKALAWINRTQDPDLTDATWAAFIANNAGNSIIHASEKQLTLDAKPSTPTFTAAT